MKQNTKKNSSLSYTTLTNEQISNGNFGEVRIYSDAIASIIKKSVQEVPGVSRISDSSVIENISGFFSSRKFQNKAINISFTENGVAIEISVSVFFGNQLQKVASDIQKKLGPKIQQLTGLKIQSINVVIRGIDEQKKGDEEILDNEQ